MSTEKNFIAAIEEITPQRITALLSGSFALQSGAVIDIQVDANLDSPMSNIACILKLEYSSDAQGNLPSTVFFKNGRMFGEVGFYKYVTPLISHPAIVPCYAARFENELGQSNLIFDDIRTTHRFLNAEETVNEKELTSVITTLAEFHRAGWEHPELGSNSKIGSSLNDLAINLALPRAKQLLESFFDVMGDDLSIEHRERYTKTLNALPHLHWLERRSALKNMTIVHGDMHTGNIALPLNEDDSVYLLDWSLWHIDTPTYDLSYLLALRTPSEIRAQVEKRLLKHYHEALNIAQYSFEQFIDDYRSSILFQTIWAVFFHSFTLQSVWKPLHNNIMQAFDDWECEGLLS